MKHRHVHAALVVDDDAAGRQALVSFLHDDGFAAIGAAHGREAIEFLRRRPPICGLVVDRVMPGLGGLAVVQFVAANRMDEPLAVIVYSGWDVDGATARRLGLAATFPKPCDPRALALALVEHCPVLARRRPRVRRPGGDSTHGPAARSIRFA